jgi:YD repeat-containing protein
MGFGDFIPDPIEDLAKKGNKALGKGVDWAGNKANKASETARSKHNANVDHYNNAIDTYNHTLDAGKDPGTKPVDPGAFHDPGAEGRKSAQEKLKRARKQRDDAADTARTAIRAARDSAPAKPSYLHQAKDGFQGLQLDATHFDAGSSPDATVIYHRDQMGRITSETCNGRTLTFAYDALGRRTCRIAPTGAATTFTHDPAGHRTALTTSGRTLAFEHDVLGQEITRRIDTTLTLNHTWDPLGRLTSQTVTGPDTSPLQQRAYTYRADGHLRALDDQLAGHRTFDRDQLGRVTAVNAQGWSERYAYDACGNLTLAHWPEGQPGHETPVNAPTPAPVSPVPDPSATNTTTSAASP